MILLTLSLLLITSCFSVQTNRQQNVSANSEEKSKDIIVKPVAGELQQQSVEKKPEGVNASLGEQGHIQQGHINWNLFFKPPPTEQEMEKILKTIDHWQDDDSLDSLHQLSRNYMAVGRYKKAELTLRQILRRDSQHKEALLDIAKLYLQMKRTKTLFTMLSQIRKWIVAEEEDNTDYIFRYRYILALAYLQVRKIDKGHRILTELIEENLQFIPGYAALASSYLQREKLAIAEFIVKRGLDQAESTPELLNILGIIAEKRLNMEAADSWYDEALKTDPNYVQALINKARLYIKKFEFDKAGNTLNRALQNNPRSFAAHNLMGLVHSEKGQIDKARFSFEKALEINPHDAQSRFNLAILYLNKLKKFSKALKTFHEVIQSAHPENEIYSISASYIDDLRNVQNTY